MKDCCVCRRAHDEEDMKSFVLTPEEKKIVAKSLPKTPDILWYCKPCLRILRDQERGATFMQGLLETNLRRAGVMDAEARAKLFKERLLTKVKK